MIPYVKDVSKWKEWVRDYRFGLILILPPEEVSRKIDLLRAKHDPGSFAACPAHISLSDPLRCELTLELEKEIQEILIRIEPFTLSYHRPYPTATYTGVDCPVTPQGTIDNLKEALHRAAVFEGKVYGRRDIPAHMTIAEHISFEEGLKLRAELQGSDLDGEFLCDHLELIVPDEDRHFQRRRTYLLGAA